MWEKEDNFLGPFKADEVVVYQFNKLLILKNFYYFIIFFDSFSKLKKNICFLCLFPPQYLWKHSILYLMINDIPH